MSGRGRIQECGHHLDRGEHRPPVARAESHRQPGDRQRQDRGPESHRPVHGSGRLGRTELGHGGRERREGRSEEEPDPEGPEHHDQQAWPAQVACRGTGRDRARSAVAGVGGRMQGEPGDEEHGQDGCRDQWSGGIDRRGREADENGAGDEHDLVGHRFVGHRAVHRSRDPCLGDRSGDEPAEAAARHRPDLGPGRTHQEGGREHRRIRQRAVGHPGQGQQQDALHDGRAQQDRALPEPVGRSPDERAAGCRAEPHGSRRRARESERVPCGDDEREVSHDHHGERQSREERDGEVPESGHGEHTTVPGLVDVGHRLPDTPVSRQDGVRPAHRRKPVTSSVNSPGRSNTATCPVSSSA